METLFISRIKDTGILIYVSSNLKYLKYKTQKYITLYKLNVEFEITVAVGIEPSRE